MFSLAGALSGLGAVFASVGGMGTVVLLLALAAESSDDAYMWVGFRPYMLVFPVLLMIGAFLVGGFA